MTSYHIAEDMLTGSTARLVKSVLIHPIEAIVAVDKAHDLALIKSPKISAPALPLGDTVYVTGNPEEYIGTFSVGYISAVQPGDVFVADKVLQMTAPISQGSSGGPVPNGLGEVIGIVSNSEACRPAAQFCVPCELPEAASYGTVVVQSCSAHCPCFCKSKCSKYKVSAFRTCFDSESPVS